MRKNNINDMTITEQLENIASVMCDKYCKYPSTWNAEKEGCELWESKICTNCPMNRL